MKVLIYINHFFGEGKEFLGKSSLPTGLDLNEKQHRAKIRREIVQAAIEQARKIPNADVMVCGIEGNSLVKLDVCFNHIATKPLWLIYESLNQMASRIGDYDYFINMEDDTFLPLETFENVLRFDKLSLVNEILLPNRVEFAETGEAYCVDMLPISGWTQQRKKFEGRNTRVALNPHSAILIFSREKFRYALDNLDKNFREPILHNELDSAFAYFHSPFCLFRSEDLGFHRVMHLDKWSGSPKSLTPTWGDRIAAVKLIDFIPPIFVKLYYLLAGKKEKDRNN